MSEKELIQLIADLQVRMSKVESQLEKLKTPKVRTDLSQKSESLPIKNMRQIRRKKIF